MTKKENEFNRLNFEDWIIIIIITLNVINIFSNQLQKKYLETDEINYLNNSSIIFIFTLIITAFIYIYFIKRNYRVYKESSKDKRNLFKIKLIGSILLLVGTIFLIYFQINDTEFIGTPAQ